MNLERNTKPNPDPTPDKSGGTFALERIADLIDAIEELANAIDPRTDRPAVDFVDLARLHLNHAKKEMG